MNTPRATSFFQSNRRIWLLAAILLIVSVLAIVLTLNWVYRSGPGAATSATGNAGTGQQNFSVGPNAQLTIKEQAGNVSVYPSHNNVITITPRKSGTTLAPDPHSVNIHYDRSLNARGNDQITVSTDPWFSNTDFSITIPDTTAVQVTVSSGSIDIHAGNGVNASTGSGGIALDNIHGPINAHTDSGDVTANTITGPITLTAASGSIRMQQINGQVNATTFSGDVIANNVSLSGNSLLQTQNGSVRFSGSLNPRGTYKMQTTSGDVDLTLPGNAAFTLDASTGSGNVENAFGDTTIGTTPRAQLSLHTQNGSIAVVKGA